MNPPHRRSLPLTTPLSEFSQTATFFMQISKKNKKLLKHNWITGTTNKELRWAMDGGRRIVTKVVVFVSRQDFGGAKSRWVTCKEWALATCKCENVLVFYTLLVWGYYGTNNRNYGPAFFTYGPVLWA